MQKQNIDRHLGPWYRCGRLTDMWIRLTCWSWRSSCKGGALHLWFPAICESSTQGSGSWLDHGSASPTHLVVVLCWNMKSVCLSVFLPPSALPFLYLHCIKSVSLPRIRSNDCYDTRGEQKLCPSVCSYLSLGTLGSWALACDLIMRPNGAAQVLYLIPLPIAKGTFNLLALFSYASLANIPGAINYLDV